MRKGFILSTAFAALLGVCVLGGASLAKESSKPIVADALSSGETIYYTRPSQSYDKTPNAFYWSEATGDQYKPMTYAYTNNMGQSVYKYTFPSAVNGFKFQYFRAENQDWGVISEWKDTWPGNNVTGYYNTKDDYTENYPMGSWTLTFFTVAFDKNGGEGTMANKTCYCDASAGNELTANAFTRTGYAFTGWNTKADGSGDSYSDKQHISSSKANETITLYAQWSKTYPTGRYIVGDFGSCEWGMEGAVHMESVNDQYEGQVQLEFGDTFKIAYYNGTGLSSYFGYSWILESCGAYHYFSGDGDSDITCYARGTYNFYFTDSTYAEGKKISIELEGSLNAEHLAAKLMGMGENPGHCGDKDRFPAMKAVYLGLSAAEKTVFQGYATSKTEQFKNAYDRYIAWASALGENPWAEGKAASANIVYGLNSEDEGSTIVFITVAAISALAFATLILIKKKRHN